MTTAAQVKKLVQPLLDQNADLAWVRREIYLKPVHHFGRMILIDRILDPDGFRPQLAAAHLFDGHGGFPLNWSQWLRKKSGPMPGSWQMQDPDVARILIETIEADALPYLRAMTSLDDYLAHTSQFGGRDLLVRPTARIIVDVALGDFEKARRTWESQRELWSVDKPSYDEEDKAMLRRLRHVGALLESDDRTGLARLLHTWEAQTVKNLKIGHLWEPTPFPLELQSA